MNFPPDPDGQNDDRANWAQHAIDAHGEITGATAAGDGDSNFADLLCNLMHWCDRQGVSLAQALIDAREVYNEETYDDNT